MSESSITINELLFNLINIQSENKFLHYPFCTISYVKRRVGVIFHS